MPQFGQAIQPNAPFRREPFPAPSAANVIPYDYEADFILTGRVGNLVQDVINISVEGVFVAVAIGYGFDENRTEPLNLVTGPGRAPANPQTLGDISLDSISPDILIEGFRINPAFAAVVAQNGQLNESLRLDTAPGILQRLKQTENFGFLLNIVDTATGRELQNEPVHSVATLGRADGRRPFKMLTQPMVFLPRSTIRLQVEERMAGVSGRLFITLQGYKIVGAANCLEEDVRRFSEFEPRQRIPLYDHESGNYRWRGEAARPDIPTTRIVPFDYVSTLDLTGKPGNLVEDEVPINVDGGYVTTAIGYSLDVPDAGVQIELTNLLLFRVDDFKNPVGLAAKLKSPAVGDVVSRDLKAQFSANTQTLLTQYDGVSPLSEALQRALIDELNQILQGASFHNPARFAGVTLRPETQSLLAQIPRGEELLRLNRMLLEDAYANEITKIFGGAESVDLKRIRLADIMPVQALVDGIRIHPLRVRFAFTSDGRLSVIPRDMVGRMFQPLNRPDEVRFFYTISDSGTGRDLQNQPVYNVAGLGIANGDRPFKVLHRPMQFLPRSTIRVQVQEIFGRGRLFIAFQGYKLLS